MHPHPSPILPSSTTREDLTDGPEPGAIDDAVRFVRDGPVPQASCPHCGGTLRLTTVGKRWSVRRAADVADRRDPELLAKRLHPGTSGNQEQVERFALQQVKRLAAVYRRRHNISGVRQFVVQDTPQRIIVIGQQDPPAFSLLVHAAPSPSGRVTRATAPPWGRICTLSGG